ncbi:nicotinic acid mononucleotide adenylyltransferase [Gluconacetobacter johannae DSM 13595]|nr:nicotinic acid mononucleotide adenylyltransferase [Gluconacetobacter johannae DSM 13595]
MASIPAWGDGRRVRIGLLGGSFNPVHAGHLQLARRALRQLRLDQVWLMVSPGNPLKPALGMAPFDERLAAVAACADGRRIIATDIERRIGTRYTVDTLARLRRRFPRAEFVWLMGADGLAQLPHWRRWRRIVSLAPFAVLPRPPYNPAALRGPAAVALARWRRPAREAPILASRAPCAWAFLPAPQTGISATALRASNAPYHPAAGVTVIARKPPADTGTTRRTAPKKTSATTGSRAAAASTVAGTAKAPGTPRKKAAVAGPGKAVRREPVETALLDKYLAIITESLADDKGEDIVVLDLTGRAAFADRMVVATGVADRQIAAMATHIERKLGEAGLKRVLIEGANGSDWVLIDAGDIVVHLFKAEARALYGLERMWGADLDVLPVGEPDGTV